VSLPAGAFVNAGADVKTNLLFFTKGRPTERVWYYDLKAVNPYAKKDEDLRAPEELLPSSKPKGEKSPRP
jgi:type I restriction enzyme M protein